jgi:hypothetical protein
VALRMAMKVGCVLLALAAACSSDMPTLPERDRGRDGDADAATRSDADFGNVDLTDPENRPMLPVSQGGEALDQCALGSTIGTGIMTGTLPGGSGVPALRTHATLDRFPGALPGVFKDVTLPVPTRLQLRRGGLIAISDNGFFDIDRNGSARFHLVNTFSTVQVLGTDLDADGDEDVITLSLNAGDAPMELEPFAVVWEREADGRLEQRGRFQTRADRNTLAATLADYDGDGDPDLVTADTEGGLHALRNDGDFELTRVALAIEATERTEAESVALFAEDRNRDGAIDMIALVNPGERMQVRVYLNDGSGAFAAPVVSHLSRARAMQASFGDVTGDGLSDLVVQNFSVDVARSIDAERFDGSRLLGYGSGFTLADVDADTVLDVAMFSAEGLAVFLARDGLVPPRVTFDVASGGLNAIAIEGATDEPARLHALYHAFCHLPCDDRCSSSCIFEACIECVAHSDCSEGQACVDMLCISR